MKMSRLEKRFVNRPAHTDHVARQEIRLLGLADIEPGGRYLDVGCGNGLTTIQVASRFGLKTTGVDLDPAQIRLARTNGRGKPGVAFIECDGASLPFAAEHFDVVGTFKTTHHIPNWPDALAEMVRVLRPGGFLAYADFVFPAWAARLGRLIGSGRAGLLTRAEIRSLARAQRLSARYWTSRWLDLEAVFQKEGRRAPPG